MSTTKFTTLHIKDQTKEIDMVSLVAYLRQSKSFLQPLSLMYSMGILLFALCIVCLVLNKYRSMTSTYYLICFP